MKIKDLIIINEKINNYYNTLDKKKKKVVLNSSAAILSMLTKVDDEMFKEAIDFLLENKKRKNITFLLSIFQDKRYYVDIIKSFLENETILNKGDLYIKNSVELFNRANSEYTATKLKSILENPYLLYHGTNYEPDSFNYANFLAYVEPRIISDYFFWPEILIDEYFIKEKLTDSFINIADDLENVIDLMESIDIIDVYFSKKDNFKTFFNHIFNKYFDTFNEKIAYLQLLFRLLCKYNFAINLDDYGNNNALEGNEINNFSLFIRYFVNIVQIDNSTNHKMLEDNLNAIIDEKFDSINIFSNKQKTLKK